MSINVLVVWRAIHDESVKDRQRAEMRKWRQSRNYKEKEISKKKDKERKRVDVESRKDKDKNFLMRGTKSE